LKINKLLDALSTIINLLIVSALLCLVVAIPVYFIWNWLVADAFIFAAKISYWQAWGIVFLICCLLSPSVSIFAGGIEVKLERGKAEKTTEK